MIILFLPFYIHVDVVSHSDFTLNKGNFARLKPPYHSKITVPCSTIIACCFIWFIMSDSYLICRSGTHTQCCFWRLRWRDVVPSVKGSFSGVNVCVCKQQCDYTELTGRCAPHWVLIKGLQSSYVKNANAVITPPLSRQTYQEPLCPSLRVLRVRLWI